MLHQGSIEHQKVASANKPVIEATPARVALEQGTADNVRDTFGQSIVAPGRNSDALGVKIHAELDAEQIVPSRPADAHSERGYVLMFFFFSIFLFFFLLDSLLSFR